MQRYSTHRSSTTPLLIAAIGVGTLVAYALSSPRRRTALAAASQSALDAGSRFVATSAERLREWIPERAQETVGRFTADAEQAASGGTSSAAGKLHDAVDRASDLMHDVVAKARRLPAEARREVRSHWRDVRDSANGHFNGGGSGRTATAGGLLLAAAAIGAGWYALQRYGGTERVRQKLGADENGRITLERTVFIQAPIEQVFDAWANYENFPRFMSNVKSVRPLGSDRSHWTVRGPAGVGVEFDSVAHMQRPTELIWESEPGSTVQTSGRVSLTPEGSGTRARVRLSYRPPAGAVGHAVSSMLGANPKREFEDDLNHMKQFLEGGTSNAPQASLPSTGTERFNP
jgi:uncharacterized membrane protein